jgi:hypothetical protein
MIVMPLKRTFRLMAAGVEATPGVELSVAVKVSALVPPVVGVPIRTPALLRVRPAGKPVADHV